MMLTAVAVASPMVMIPASAAVRWGLRAALSRASSTVMFALRAGQRPRAAGPAMRWAVGRASSGPAARRAAMAASAPAAASAVLWLLWVREPVAIRARAAAIAV